uniref:Uncharacterized protein n=1 Tax=Anopheles atroparvus TaxID=41427 RepID=A0A182JA99_ANOAO
MNESGSIPAAGRRGCLASRSAVNGTTNTSTATNSGAEPHSLGGTSFRFSGVLPTAQRDLRRRRMHRVRRLVAIGRIGTALPYLSALARSCFACSASSMVGTRNRAIRNCDCCWELEPAPPIPPPPPAPTAEPSMVQTPTPVDTIGNEEDAAIWASRPPAFRVMIVWFWFACVVPTALLLLTPVAFGAVETTVGCCCRLGSRSNC